MYTKKWHIRINGENDYTILEPNPDAGKSGVVYSGDYLSICHLDNLEDAQLIAQSPRMYEWLKDIGLHMAVNYDDNMCPIFTIDNDYLDEAKSIVAKAEGK